MPRNRMIKPEFWDDEKLSKVSMEARLVFIGLWNFSDDYGVVKGDSRWLKNHILPYEDSLRTRKFTGWLNELVNIFIFPFTDNGEQYYLIKNFLKHQTISRPSQQRNPIPPDTLIEDSLSNHGVLTSEEKLSISIKEKETRPPVAPTPEKISGAVKDIVDKKENRHFENKVGEFFKSIKESCDWLSEYFNGFQWTQKKVNEKAPPPLIDESLKGLKQRIIRKDMEAVDSPYGYIEKIYKTLKQKFSEAEAITYHEAIKKEHAVISKIMGVNLFKEV